MTQTSSTGKNDSTSAYGAGFSNLFNSALNTAGGVFASLNQTKAEKEKAKANSNLAAAQAKQSDNNVRMVVIGAGALVVVIIAVVLFRRRK